jgi:hypothetical protein
MFGRDHERHAALYIDRAGEAGIVVPLHYNGRQGPLVEDENPVVLRPPGPVALSDAIGDAMGRSIIQKEIALRDSKLTEWPAFRASGSTSVRRFESEFIKLLISGANDANVTLIVEGWPEFGSELAISTAISASSIELGERCLLVWRACRDRVF